MQAVVHSLGVALGDFVVAGQEVVILEAMKMHHVLNAPVAGDVVGLSANLGDVVDAGQVLLEIAVSDVASSASEGLDGEADGSAGDLDILRADLFELKERLAKTEDAARPEKIAKRHARGHRSARENVADLCDAGSFIEYGQLVVAAQRGRRSLDDLIDNTPADGIITGIGCINGAHFGSDASRAAILAYDYTVLAGTQGAFNHKKTDRVLELARDWGLPIVFFTEGGGGRPGDTDFGKVQAATLDVMTFATFAQASGVAPRIAINNGRCFAGNAVFFGCADVTIATRDSSIGMGGPAMIEGGGLGVYAPDDVGPMDVQTANGVVDLLAADEADAVAQAKQLLGYFQGRLSDWRCADQRKLRSVVPQDRKRAYDMRDAIGLLSDEGSFLELRSGYGVGMVTGFLRIEGISFGVIANNPHHLGGAIDAVAAEKAARFLQLCDGFDLPVLSLCDTPGFMVGPDYEKQATVRRASHMMVVGASLSVPIFMVCLRKGYGLGAQAMAMGSFRVPNFTISWPTGEFGPMGLEGAVRLGYSKELAAAGSDAERDALFEKLLAASYARGQAISVASFQEIDAVIDPAETRAFLCRGIRTMPVGQKGRVKKRPFISAW